MRGHVLVVAFGVLLLATSACLARAEGQSLAPPLQFILVATPTNAIETVTIDIKPGSNVNPINPKSHGVTPVAVLSSDSFDATMVDPATVLLAGAPVAVCGGRYLANQADVNGDGLTDLMLHIETDELDLSQLADGIAVMTGSTFDGVLFEGQDIVTIVPHDLADDFWALEEVATCIRAGIVTGYPDDTYRAEVPVSREQMAVFISRSLASGDLNVPAGPATAAFSDVPVDHWAFDYVEYAVAQGVVQGFSEGDYQPALPVDRGQMAVFIARALGWVELGDAMHTAPHLFPDVPAGFWAGAAIKACLDHGVVRGYEDGSYRPSAIVSRDQMAVYLARAFQPAT